MSEAFDSGAFDSGAFEALAPPAVGLTNDTWDTVSPTYDGLTGTYDAPNYPLNTIAGAFVITDASANLVFGRLVASTPGAFSLTGSSARTLFESRLQTTQGSYSIAGVSAQTLNNRLLTTTPGSYLLSGVSATTLYQRQLQTTPGSYSITGSAAQTIAIRRLEVASGSYSITGINAQTLAARLLTTTPAAYSVAGASAQTLLGRALDTTPGAFVVIGSDAQTLVNRQLQTTPGSVEVTGLAADLTLTPASSTTAYLLTTDPASYAIGGADASLTYSGEIAAPSSSFGFEMSGGVRTVSFKPLMQRIREARAERIKPVKKSAKRKAVAIEFKAAELATAGGNEAAFFALMQQWLEQKPQIPEAPSVDLEQLFMAQVAMRIAAIEEQRRKEFEQDEEEALMALLA